MYGIVGGEIRAADIAHQLSDIGPDEVVEAHVNSPGGSVDEGFAIYNGLRNIPNKVVIHIDSFAGSVMGLIAMAGDEINISEAGHFHLHNALMTLTGDHNKLRDQADMLEKVSAIALKAYVARTGLPQKDVEQLMDLDTRMTAFEAKEFGFVDNVIPITSERKVALTNYNDMDLNSLKALFTTNGVTTLEEEENKEVIDALAKESNEAIEAKADEIVAEKIESLPGEAALLGDLVPRKEYEVTVLKNNALIQAMYEFVSEQPSKDEIRAELKAEVKAEVADELNNLLLRIKSKGVVPAPVQKAAELAVTPKVDMKVVEAKVAKIAQKNNR